MRAVLTTLALVLAATAASATTDDELRTMMIGTWGDTADCANGTLTFNADGTFVSAGADPASGTLDGTFEIVEGKLNGKAGDLVMPQVEVRFDGETLMLVGDGAPGDSLVHCAPGKPAQQAAPEAAPAPAPAQ